MGETMDDAYLDAHSDDEQHEGWFFDDLDPDLTPDANTDELGLPF